MTNTFIERVGNSIDLESTADPVEAWMKLKGEGVECSYPEKSVDELVVPDVRKEARDSKKPLMESSCLIPYPVFWHTPGALTSLNTSDREEWDFYSHCKCSGSTRYYGKGEKFDWLFPKVFSGRPPCCFTTANVEIAQGGIVCISDENNRILLSESLDMPVTLRHNDKRDVEERLMLSLIKNIWWIANEHCQKIVIANQDDVVLIKTSYPSQLAIPLLADNDRISLECLTQKLADIYRHVEFYLKNELIQPSV